MKEEEELRELRDIVKAYEALQRFRTDFITGSLTAVDLQRSEWVKVQSVIHDEMNRLYERAKELGAYVETKNICVNLFWRIQ